MSSKLRFSTQTARKKRFWRPKKIM